MHSQSSKTKTEHANGHVTVSTSCVRVRDGALTGWSVYYCEGNHKDYKDQVENCLEPNNMCSSASPAKGEEMVEHAS